MTHLLKRLWSQEEAQNLTEYALLLFLISLTAVTAMGSMATRVGNAYSDASTYVAAPSQQGSLSGGSLSYGSQASTNKPSPFKDSNSANPD